MKNKNIIGIIAVVIALAVAAVIGVSLSKDKTVDIPETTTESSVDSFVDNTEDTENADNITDVTNAENIGETSEEIPANKETVSDTTAALTSADSFESVEEIVNLYNTSVNRVKSEAKQLTRNYKKLSSMDNYLQLPSAIESIGRSAINTFVKGENEPQTWTKKEDIKIIFPVGKEDYSSHLTADMVKSATCKDNGNTYQIDIKLYNDKMTSPAKGKGYAGVFNTVTASTFEEISIPTVTFHTVKVNGINGRISCTIDKATGRVIKANYKNADILYLGVKVAFADFDVQFALNAEEDYTINY